MSTLWELLISFMTIGTVYLTGSLHRITPVWGIITECCWLIWVVSYGHWGLLPMNIVLVAMWVRVLVLWRKDG